MSKAAPIPDIKSGQEKSTKLQLLKELEGVPESAMKTLLAQVRRAKKYGNDPRVKSIYEALKKSKFSFKLSFPDAMLPQKQERLTVTLLMPEQMTFPEIEREMRVIAYFAQLVVLQHVGGHHTPKNGYYAQIFGATGEILTLYEGLKFLSEADHPNQINSSYRDLWIKSDQITNQPPPEEDVKQVLDYLRSLNELPK